jgi:hypothetical protein
MEKKGSDQRRAVPVTTARARLFDLVDDVLTGRSSRVELAHRDHDEHVVLVRKGELEGMEADLLALRSRLGPEPRPLRGMGALTVEPEQILVRTRARQARLAAEKRASRRAPDGRENPE